MELCCFSFSSALALSFSSALQWGCCRGGSAGAGGKGGGINVVISLVINLVINVRQLVFLPAAPPPPTPRGKGCLGTGEGNAKSTIFYLCFAEYAFRHHLFRPRSLRRL